LGHLCGPRPGPRPAPQSARSRGPSRAWPHPPMWPRLAGRGSTFLTRPARLPRPQRLPVLRNQLAGRAAARWKPDTRRPGYVRPRQVANHLGGAIAAPRVLSSPTGADSCPVPPDCGDRRDGYGQIPWPGKVGARLQSSSQERSFHKRTAPESPRLAAAPRARARTPRQRTSGSSRSGGTGPRAGGCRWRPPHHS
jgi:hypothetical protein